MLTTFSKGVHVVSESCRCSHTIMKANIDYVNILANSHGIGVVEIFAITLLNNYGYKRVERI